MRRLPLLLLLALTALACAPTHAFLSNLLGIAAAEEQRTDDPWKHSPSPVPSSDVALPSDASGRFLVSETGSISDLHANYRELMRTTANIPACRGASSHAELANMCNHLTRENRQRIAAAFTECHLATDTYMNIQSCQDSSSINTCIKEMNQDATVLHIYTSFRHAINQICEDVQHDFKLKRTHEAFDSALAATSDMAQALKQWQKDAYASAADLKRDVHAKSSELLSELLRHSDAEAARYESLSAQTTKIETGQKSMMDQMTEQAQGVQRLLGDAETIQKLIHATSNDIERTQHEIVTLQRDASAVAGQTHADLLTLKQSQQAEFEKARSSLTELQSLQHKLSLAQEKGLVAVEALTKDQARAFAAAASDLASLASEQAASFRRGQEALGALASQQTKIAAEQDNILGAVRTSGDELRRLSEAQADSFALAGRTLASLRSQAEDAERRLGAVLGELKHVAAQILSVNLDMVSELFRIESAMFYVAFAPLIYMLTATERTQAARFWIFALLLATLIIELSLVSTAHRFHYTLSSAQFDALRANIRYALSCLSCLSLLLSVLTHKDYGQLTYSVSRESRVHLDNNHRMLHELLRRTESLSPPPKSGSSAAVFQPNPFQSRAPPRDQEEEEPQIEGVKRALTPRKAERLSMSSTSAAASLDGSWVDWRQIDPNTCGCPGHAPPKPSMFSFISPKHARNLNTTSSTTGGGGHARTPSSTLSPAAAAAASTSSAAPARHARTVSTTPAAAAAAASSPEPGVQSEGEDEYEHDAAEDQEEGVAKPSAAAAAASAAAGSRARSPRASSRSRSPSPSASPPAAAAAYAAPSRVTRSASRSQSMSNPANMRAAAARLSTTPLRKSAGPKFLGGAGHDSTAEADEEESQPGEETPRKGSIKKGAAARRKS